MRQSVETARLMPAPASLRETNQHAGHGRRPAISDQAVIHDEQVARLFSNLRRTLELPLGVIAYRLNVEEGTLARLEAGRLDGLPPWPELERLVRNYLAALQIAPDPVVASLKAKLAERGLDVGREPTPHSAPDPAGSRLAIGNGRGRAKLARSASARGSHGRGRRRALAGVGLVAVALMAGAAIAGPLMGWVPHLGSWHMADTLSAIKNCLKPESASEPGCWGPRDPRVQPGATRP